MSEADNKAEAIQKLFDQMEDQTMLTFASGAFTVPTEEDEEPKPLRLTAVFSFSEKGFGFDEITLVVGPDGQMYMHTERTNKEHVKRILGRLVDAAIDECDKDPERHKKYVAVMRQSCGHQCEICHPVTE